MAAGIEIYNYVTNQKGSPAIYSDILGNRPAAGFIGRLFVSTDTLEIYRDNGITWDLISGGGGGGVNIYNSDGTLTGTRTVSMAGNNLTFEGGASTNRIAMSANNNVPRIFSFRTAGLPRWAFRVDGNETGLNSGSDWALRAYDDAGVFTFSPITAARNTGEKIFYAQEALNVGTAALAGVFNIAGGTYGAGLTFIGGNAHAAQFNNFTLANGGSFTFAASSFVGANGNVLRLQANSSGTVTFTPATPGIRTAAVSLNQIQYNTSGSAALTYTHASVLQALGILQLVTSGSLTITNAYSLIINDLNEYGNPSTGPGALILTNRWGIYQDSTTDVNYFGGTTLIGTTTNNGNKLQISGSMSLTGNIFLSPTATIRNTGSQFIDYGSGGSGDLYIRGGSGFANVLTATNAGNIGIGTAAPPDKITVQSSLGNAAAMTFRANGVTNINELFVGQSIGNDAFFYNRANAIISFGTANIERARFVNSGNFLINTTTDSGQKLQINSSLRLIPTATVPTASAGTLYYDNATNKLKLYDGTSWVDLN